MLELFICYYFYTELGLSRVTIRSVRYDWYYSVFKIFGLCPYNYL